MDARLTELWLRLSADAVRGTSDAQRALRSLGEGPLSPDALSSWMGAFMPAAGGGRAEPPPATADLQQLAEQWWRVMGVVPRYRYDELLQRYHELRDRLEEAERTVRRLRGALPETPAEEVARGVLDSWERLTQQTLDAQAEWAQVWLRPMGKEEDLPDGG